MLFILLVQQKHGSAGILALVYELWQEIAKEAIGPSPSFLGDFSGLSYRVLHLVLRVHIEGKAIGFEGYNQRGPEAFQELGPDFGGRRQDLGLDSM